MRLKSHNFETLQHYFRNLFRALLGRNPFRDELNELREHYEAVAERVQALTELYYTSAEALGRMEREKADNQLLIENLRKRVDEKDKEIKRMKDALKKAGPNVLIDYYGEKA